MKKYIVSLLLFASLLFSCKKKEEQAFPLLKNKEVKSSLIRYQNYEDNYLEVIQKNQLDLRRIYSDSANYYDSLIHTKSGELNDLEFHFFKTTVDSLKRRRIEALKKVNN